MSETNGSLRARKPEDKLIDVQNAVAALREQEARQTRELEELKDKLACLSDCLEGKTRTSFSGEDDPLAENPAFDHGAGMIGKTVLEAAKFCGNLSADAYGSSAKELVNLILGKAELTKAEILKIVLSEISDSEKKKTIDRQYEQAIDYFESVMAQIQ